MNGENHSSRSSSRGYWKGFGSALLFLFVIAAGVRAAKWVASHPFPQALVEMLTKPLFSVADLATMAMLLVVLWAMVWMAAYGPRMN